MECTWSESLEDLFDLSHAKEANDWQDLAPEDENSVFSARRAVYHWQMLCHGGFLSRQHLIFWIQLKQKWLCWRQAPGCVSGCISICSSGSLESGGMCDQSVKAESVHETQAGRERRGSICLFNALCAPHSQHSASGSTWCVHKTARRALA